MISGVSCNHKIMNYDCSELGKLDLSLMVCTFTSCSHGSFKQVLCLPHPHELAALKWSLCREVKDSVAFKANGTHDLPSALNINADLWQLSRF